MGALHKWVYGGKHVSELCGCTWSQERDVADVFPLAASDTSFSHAGVSSGMETRSCTHTAGTLGRDWGFFQLGFFTLKAA